MENHPPPHPTQSLEGRQVSLALADGSRIDDVSWCRPGGRRWRPSGSSSAGWTRSSRSPRCGGVEPVSHRTRPRDPCGNPRYRGD